LGVGIRKRIEPLKSSAAVTDCLYGVPPSPKNVHFFIFLAENVRGFVMRPASHTERKCADTIGTVLVPWAGHFQC